MFGFGQSADIKIELTNVEHRKYEIFDNGYENQRRYIYYDGDDIEGKVILIIFLNIIYILDLY